MVYSFSGLCDWPSTGTDLAIIGEDSAVTVGWAEEADVAFVGCVAVCGACSDLNFAACKDA